MEKSNKISLQPGESYKIRLQYGKSSKRPTDSTTPPSPTDSILPLPQTLIQLRSG